MVTRRTKRKQTRKGGNWLSQKLRRLGLYDAGPSTSLLAREIYAMIGPTGIKDYRQRDFENLMFHHQNVNRDKLLRDLQNVEKGMTPKQEYDVVANLNAVLPSRPERYETTTM